MDALRGHKETIAVIGGGLGGCLTALMLVKNGYHVTLIEGQDTLLNGASRIASRLHEYGFEYPKDMPTRMDCLNHAILWKLFMPENIYTPPPPTMFLVLEESERLGQKKKRGEALTRDEEKSAITLEEYAQNSETIRVQYESDYKALESAFGVDKAKALLLGSYEQEAFCRPLAPHEYADYSVPSVVITAHYSSPYHGVIAEMLETPLQKSIQNAKDRFLQNMIDTQTHIADGTLQLVVNFKPGTDLDAMEKIVQGCVKQSLPNLSSAVTVRQRTSQIAGGFQTQERGINVPKYLAMIQHAVEKEAAKGNITLLTGHRVTPIEPGAKKKHEKKNGIRGKLGNFKIYCKHAVTENGQDVEKKVTVRASQVVQAAWSGGPELSRQMSSKKEHEYNAVHVYRRAMLLVDLPEGWKTPPAFIMLGHDGGMISPYNDKTAICYLPTEDCAYVNEHRLTRKTPSLPDGWNLEPRQRQAWTDRYFSHLKKRCPLMEKAHNPRLIVADTLNFQHVLSRRRHQSTQEAFMPARITQSLEMQQRQELVQTLDVRRSPLLESPRKKGLFTFYPTKATYAPGAAAQAVMMVDMRRKYPVADIVMPPDMLQHIIKSTDPGNELARYSLAGMEVPGPEFMDRFFREHPDLTPAMMEQSWTPPQKNSGEKLWVDTVAGGQGKGSERRLS